MRDLFDRFQSKPFLALTVIYLTAGSLCGLFLYYVYTAFYFNSYFVIVLFYGTTGLITHVLFERSNRKQAEKSFTVYFAIRVAKFILTIVFLSVFLLFVMAENYKLPFAIALMGNFLLYSIFELYLFNRYHKRLKNNATKE
jgi:hypothetical protein